jgi:DNA-binding transcriptional regulator YiaG
MRTKKNIPATPETPRPRTGNPIRVFRESLSMNPAQFANELGLTRVAVVHWESGRSDPGGGAYIALAKLAMKKHHSAAALYFWERAGVDLATLRQLSPAISKAFKEFEENLGSARAGSTMVPILRGIEHIGAPALAPVSEIETWISLPARSVPNPGSTSGVRVGGLSSVSIFGSDDIAVVDASQKNISDLYMGMIAVYHARKQWKLQEGIYVGWLNPWEFEGRQVPLLTLTRTIQETVALNQLDLVLPLGGRAKQGLVPMLAAAFEGGWAIPIGAEPDWLILGRVIAWLATDRPVESRAKKKQDAPQL